MQLCGKMVYGKTLRPRFVFMTSGSAEFRLKWIGTTTRERDKYNKIVQVMKSDLGM